MWLAGEAPERVECLVLCCTSARFAPPETWEERAQTVREDGLGAIADAVLERSFTPVFRANRPEAFEWAGRMLRETPAEGYAGCCEAIRDADLHNRLDAVRADTLVVTGADDPAASPEQADLITRSIPDARFLVIEQAAHLANVERPGEVTRAVLNHLGSISRKGE